MAYGHQTFRVLRLYASTWKVDGCDYHMLFERVLVLTRCNFLDWDSKLLTGLTYLTVHYIARNNRPSTQQVLSALRRYRIWSCDTCHSFYFK